MLNSFTLLSCFRSPLAPIRQLGRIKERLKKTRYYVYSFISIWKIVLFFSTMFLFLYLNGVPIGPMFGDFSDGFGQHKINVTRVLPHSHLAPLDIPGGGKLQEVQYLHLYFCICIFSFCISVFCVSVF